VKKTDEYFFNEEIIITIENYDKSNETILFDFLDTKHFNRFLENYKAPLKHPNDASMMLFHNFKITKGFQLGVCYNIKISFFEHLIDAELQLDSEVIFLNINLKGKDIREFIILSKVSKQYIYESNDHSTSRSSQDTLLSLNNDSKEKELIVKCVGQGSWNEFSFNGNVKVVYDIGTSYLHDKKTVKNLMEQRDLDYQKSKPIIVLSHWDVDHYHMLLVADDKTIEAVKAFVYRSYLPNNTSKKLIDRFLKLNPTALCPIQEEIPVIGRTSTKLKKIFGDCRGYMDGYWMPF